MKTTPAKTVVVKVGSSSLTDDNGKFRLGPVAGLVDELAGLHAAGHRMLLVSSGAVSSGMGLLGLKQRPAELDELQAAAAVGQGGLYHTYSQLFAYKGITTGQVLLTAADVVSRTQYKNARNTLRRLLEWRVLPIINENDTVSTDELRFGDNDTLAAQITVLLHADLLVLLTDTDGLYTANPNTDAAARLIPEVRDFAALSAIDLSGKGRLGLGGMRSKVNASRIAASGGADTVIAAASKPGSVRAAVAGQPAGTRVFARERGLSAFKLWLLYGKPARGTLVIDAGAAKALRGGSSLLPVGIREVRGDFSAGDAVTIVDDAGAELAKGISNHSSSELQSIRGKRSAEVLALLPGTDEETIHRDQLALTSDA